MSYECDKIHCLFSEFDKYNFPFNINLMPHNGIYILFEKGEIGHGVDRIVRIGTHTGQNQLRSRLKQHFLLENKDRSIFRKNIGRALLRRDSDPYLDVWEIDQTTRMSREKYSHLINIDHQKDIENRISSYLRKNFKFVVFQVNSKEDRLTLESRLISTVSTCKKCRPSANWLGNYSSKEKISESGLWQVNELYKKPFSENELEEFIQKLSKNNKARVDDQR